MFFSPKYISILLIYNIKDKKIYKVSFSSDIYIRYIIYLHRNFLVNLQYKNALFFKKIYIYSLKKVKMHIYSCCEIFCDMIMIRRDRHSLRTLHRQLDSLLVYFLYYLIILFFLVMLLFALNIVLFCSYIYILIFCSVGCCHSLFLVFLCFLLYV